VRTTSRTPVGLDLLDKHELRLVGVELRAADLRTLADAVAGALDLDPGEVLVTDVLADAVTLDVLRPSLYAHQLLGRDQAVLTAAAGVGGVDVTEGATVEARGVLGWIGAAPEVVMAAIADGRRQLDEVQRRVARRAVVFSTGAEMAAGEVRDTNRTTLERALDAAGFDVTFGGHLQDDRDRIAGAIRAAVDRGHGVVITTGGTGAEAKDCTVEAVVALDPAASTPYLAKFTPGTGRHVKDGVRIAVGQHKGSLVVALPGPNEEVRLALPAVLDGLAGGLGCDALAAAIADVLRTHLRSRAGRPVAAHAKEPR